MPNPYIIGISGESGVGKSTIAEVISIFYGTEQTTIVSTDDLHKWERSDTIWENITHLNPEANNLELGDTQLYDLSQKKNIFRSVYNHTTGRFNPPIKIIPADFVIVEGLHAFYTDASKELINLKIFIDTDEELRTHWKILRDTEERGYKYNSVLETINKRKNDNIKIKNVQINSADVIIKISTKSKIICLGDKNEKIDLVVSISSLKNNNYNDLFEFVEQYINNYNLFIKISSELGKNIELCQNGGGNISTKISDNHMIIKSSGFALKDVYKSGGYSIVKIDQILNAITSAHNDEVFDNDLQQSIISLKYKKPSMEAGFHAVLDKYIIHLHPIYITLLLCLDNSENIIQKLFSDLNYQYIDYISPGYQLSKKLNAGDKKEIYFLANHGIILSSNNVNHLLNLLDVINDKSKSYIKNNCDFKEFNLSFADLKIENDYTFPDAVIFLNKENKKEITASHNYINIIGSKIDKLRYLSTEQVNYLQSLKSEQYRKIL